MSSIKIKICGMKYRENILEVAALNPDFMGFIFYGNSPRYVGSEFKIPMELDPSIKRVGVFVNESTDQILEFSARHHLDYIQLHGDETPAQCRSLKAKELGVIKVFAVDESFDFALLTSFEPFVDYFLFDAKGAKRGGNGVPFDWNVLVNNKSSVPFLLGGGINSDNVNTIAQLNCPTLYAIDVNSGAEEVPGRKSKTKLETLLSKIKKQQS